MGLPIPMPVCDICGETINASLCGADARSADSVRAIQAIMVAAHKKLAGCVVVPDDLADLEQPRPACFDECTGLLKALALETGTELHVQQMPADGLVAAHPGYPPHVMTCPHGVSWVCEPTGEQIAEWVRTQAP